MQALDTELGRLIDSLRILNRLDSTDFIFIGDNGNESRTIQNSDTGKAKGTIYQYGVHVPFIIAGPSIVNPNRVSEALVNTADIFATVLELFGMSNWPSQINPNKPVDSKSILPIIKNTSIDIRPWSFCEIFRLMPDEGDAKAIRNVVYKLLRFDNGKQEFYHLKNDPEENIDLFQGSLSVEAITHYNYLCNEMNHLLELMT
ncbi:MAG: sulfatase-like hydrolase/transferase [Saprospiraceae bacterium]|uniref:Sulfatase-like hydrolase/transferase n=1 Tax=Candidatus Defluviibacterium haderslevense TaxID=2981993 RepID=A0A9D7SB13_9BACT|nr:sulfatase-like hydrolase/transferase [Candidatus Defluviibacterium haderslevense]